MLQQTVVKNSYILRLQTIVELQNLYIFFIFYFPFYLRSKNIGKDRNFNNKNAATTAVSRILVVATESINF